MQHLQRIFENVLPGDTILQVYSLDGPCHKELKITRVDKPYIHCIDIFGRPVTIGPLKERYVWFDYGGFTVNETRQRPERYNFHTRWH